MANRVNDVAQWMIDRGETRKIHLQKLTYFGQVWSLVWTGRPLVDVSFEAWPNGPVSRDLYRITTYEWRDGDLPGADPDRLCSVDRATIEAVMDHYAPMAAGDLIEVSHDEAWSAARRGLRPATHSQEELDIQIAVREYTRRSILGLSGPRQPGGVGHSGFDPHVVEAEARRQDEKWADLHARLAEA